MVVGPSAACGFNGAPIHPVLKWKKMPSWKMEHDFRQ